MRMRKTASVIAALLMALTLFAGCGASYQDGVYHAEFKDYDSHGWKEYVDVQVQDNKVTVLTFDGVNADGDKKSEDEDYRASMEPVKGTYPAKRPPFDVAFLFLENGETPPGVPAWAMRLVLQPEDFLSQPKG